jgi:hypothetical protein
MMAVTVMACGDNAPSTQPSTPEATTPAARPLRRELPAGTPTTLLALRERNPARWVGDSVQAMMQAYRADYLARKKAKLPRQSVCQGMMDFFTTRSPWGRQLARSAPSASALVTPQCDGPARRVRVFGASFSKATSDGAAYVTPSSMAWLDSLSEAARQVDEVDASLDQAVSLLVGSIDRIERQVVTSSLTDQEYELVETVISGMEGAIAEGRAEIPSMLQDISGSVDDCEERIGQSVDNPDDCDQEIYEILGPGYRVPRAVLMCSIAMKASPFPDRRCDGHEIIEGIAYGFIGGAVSGAWAGLLTTGGLGVPLTALLGGIGGSAAGLAVGLSKTVWCEMHRYEE